MVCKCVLVVEDDIEIRYVLKEALEIEGYEVYTAGNGKEAIDTLLNTACHPCLILLDLMMPVMSGWEFLKHRHENDTLATIPVVVVSAAGERKLQEAEAEGVVKKPINLDLLLNWVNRFCRGTSESGIPKSSNSA